MFILGVNFMLNSAFLVLGVNVKVLVVIVFPSTNVGVHSVLFCVITGVDTASQSTGSNDMLVMSASESSLVFCIYIPILLIVQRPIKSVVKDDMYEVMSIYRTLSPEHVNRGLDARFESLKLYRHGLFVPETSFVPRTTR